MSRMKKKMHLIKFLSKNVYLGNNILDDNILHSSELRMILYFVRVIHFIKYKLIQLNSLGAIGPITIFHTIL